MSFLGAVHAQIKNRQPGDPVRVTLEFLLAKAVGRKNAKSTTAVVAHLRTHQIYQSIETFQQTVLAESRAGDFFIGSSRKGIFLIETIDDAREVQEFYNEHIERQKKNLEKLEEQSHLRGWQI